MKPLQGIGASQFGKFPGFQSNNMGCSPCMNIGNGLPDFTDRNSFPTFFLTKSGSFEKSPNNSFVFYSRPTPTARMGNTLNNNSNNINNNSNNLGNNLKKQ